MLLAPAPAGGLTTSGKPAQPGEVGGVGGGAGQPVPRARHARGAQYRLHLGLVPEIAGRDHAHAGNAELLAHLREGHLQLLQDGQQPLHRPELAAEARRRGGDLADIESVVYSPVPGQVVSEPGRQAVLGLAGDQRQLDVGQRGRGLHEPRRGVEEIGRDEPGDHHGKNVPSYHSKHERRLRRAVLPG